MQRRSILQDAYPKQLSIGLLILRLFIGLRLLYGVVDNIISWAQMKEFATFLARFHFPLPIVSAAVSVYAQAVCALFILLGIWVRPAAVVMVANFAIALVAVHFPLGDGIEAMTPALALFFGCLVCAHYQLMCTN